MPTWSRDGEASRTLVDPELVKLLGREPTKLFSLSGLEEGACSLLAEKDWVRGEVRREGGHSDDQLEKNDA